MDVREKLVELCEDLETLPCCENYEGQADYLIANGVTVQEWISVKERLPEENVRVLVCFRFTDYSQIETDTDRIEKGKWYRWSKYVTHWMPLPQPPKGE